MKSEGKKCPAKYFKFSLHIYAVVVRYSENVCLLLSFTSCYGRADVIFFPLLVSSFLAYCKIQWHTTNQNKRANSTKTAANANQIHLLCISVHLVHSFCDSQPSSVGVLSLWLDGSVLGAQLNEAHFKLFSSNWNNSRNKESTQWKMLRLHKYIWPRYQSFHLK